MVLKMNLLRKSEKGIALIFTLIVLSLLLILALGFTLNSMFDQKAAYNAANKSFAAFLAQTQLKQVLSLIKNDEANLENSMFYSHDSGSPAVTDPNMLKDMLSERLPVADLLSSTAADKVNWNYIRSEDLEKLIIGRTAFAAITGGVPLDSLVDGRTGTAAYPKHNEKLNTETRVGKYVSEINVRSAVPNTVTALGTAETDAMAAVLNWATDKPVTGAGFAGGQYTGGWTDFSSLFKVIETAVASSLTTPQKEEFQSNLSISAAKDKEAFWADKDGDTNIDSNELYKRFDLTRNWDTADNAADFTFIKENILLDSNGDGTPDLDMEAWDDTDSNAGSKGLPWLAGFGYKDDGTLYTVTDLNSTFSSVSAQRCQIAANLKDYCDPDDRPTSDVDPAIASAVNWVNCATHPDFTGNEKTPYINTAGFKIAALRTESGSGSSYTVGTDIEITPCIGLINIYGSNWPSEDLTVVIKGDVDIETTVGTDNKSTSIPNALDCTITIVKDITGDWTTTGYSKFKMSSSAYTKSTNGHSVSSSGQSISVKVTGIKINKIVLHNGTVAYDYTKLLSSPAGYSREFFSGSSGGGTGWFGFAVHDPRQNLNNGDWLCLTSSSVDDPATVFSLTGTDPYYGAANSSAPSSTESPAAGSDPETTADPANAALSTAFIRNAPMESPWELGFIHRGVRWQTVNLKKYDSLKAYKTVTIGTKKYIPGGGLYSSGDANILDQIKMTEKPESPQKINLKSQKTAVFDALFSKVKLGCSIDSVMSVKSMAGIDPAAGTALSGTEINLSGADYLNMRTNIINMFKLVGTANRTRAAVAGELVLPTGAATDAAQEELIGKIVNLTKVNGKVCSFTIVILAQMIKDVGGPVGSPFNVIRYSGDASISGTQGCEVSVFNADINDINNLKKNIYYDEITAEQKIIVKGYRTIDGNIKITSFKYVE